MTGSAWSVLLLNVVSNVLETLLWGMSMSDITLWLKSLGLEKYDELLSSHDVDLAVAPGLTEQDLGWGYRSGIAVNSSLPRQSFA